MKLKSLLLVPVILVLCFSSCSKVEGEGGAAKIKGKVIIHNYNSAGTLISTYPAADEDVYIIYGNENSFYDNDVKTSYDGSFEFRYLQKGNYQVFVYEDCQTCASGDTVVMNTINVSEKNQVVDLGEIIVRKY